MEISTYSPPREQLLFKQTASVKLWSFQPVTPLSRNTNIPTSRARCQGDDIVPEGGDVVVIGPSPVLLRFI